MVTWRYPTLRSAPGQVTPSPIGLGLGRHPRCQPPRQPLLCLLRLLWCSGGLTLRGTPRCNAPRRNRRIPLSPPPLRGSRPCTCGSMPSFHTPSGNPRGHRTWARWRQPRTRARKRRGSTRRRLEIPTRWCTRLHPPCPRRRHSRRFPRSPRDRCPHSPHSPHSPRRPPRPPRNHSRPRQRRPFLPCPGVPRNPTFHHFPPSLRAQRAPSPCRPRDTVPRSQAPAEMSSWGVAREHTACQARIA